LPADFEVQRALKLRDVAIAGLHLGDDVALHPADAKVACLSLGWSASVGFMRRSAWTPSRRAYS
jgi:hypothetical protein